MKNKFFNLIIFLIFLVLSKTKSTNDTIPFSVENLTNDSKPLKIIIPSEVIQSFVCREIELQCELPISFLRSKILNGEKITKNEFDICEAKNSYYEKILSETELKQTLPDSKIKITSKFSLPEVYYKECKFPYEYYKENLIEQIEKYLEKLYEKKSLFSRFKVLEINIPDNSFLTQTYFFLDKNEFNKKNFKIDLIFIKTDLGGETYLYRIKRGEDMKFFIKEKKYPANKQNLENQIFTRENFDRKSNIFRLITKNDKNYDVVKAFKSKVKSEFYCKQDIYNFYQYSFRERKLFSVYYLEPILDWKYDLSNSTCTMNFKKIDIHYKIKEFRLLTFAEEMALNPSLVSFTALNMNSINLNLMKSNNSTEYEDELKNYNQQRTKEYQLPEVHASNPNKKITGEYFNQDDLNRIFEDRNYDEEKKNLEKELKMSSFLETNSGKIDVGKISGNNKYKTYEDYLNDTLNESLNYVIAPKQTEIKEQPKKVVKLKNFNNIVNLSNFGFINTVNDVPNKFFSSLNN